MNEWITNLKKKEEAPPPLTDREVCNTNDTWSGFTKRKKTKTQILNRDGEKVFSI